MKFFLVILLIIEVLLVGVQFASIQFGFQSQIFPYLVRLSARAVPGAGQSEGGNLPELNMDYHEGGTVEQFEELRKKQIGELAKARDMHPVTEIGVSGYVEQQVLPLPTKTTQLTAAYIQTFQHFHRGYGVQWFNAQMVFPIPLRLLLWLPLLLPLILIRDLISWKMRPKDEYGRFLQAAKAKKLKTALPLFKKDPVQLQFKLEDRKTKKRWFTQLTKTEEDELTCFWGTYLYTEDPDDKKFHRKFAKFLTDTFSPIDLKYSKLLTWYLKDQKDIVLAEVIWEETFKPTCPSVMDSDVEVLAKTLQELLGSEEIESFIQVRLDSASGKTEYSTA